MSFIPADESARDIVRQELGISMAIEAGAGTGKTTLLVDRLVRLLAHYELPELVAITFTEKAAGELVDRLRRELERGWKPDTPLAGSPRRRIEALRDLDRAHISTIHAFASSLIRTYAFDISIDSDFQHLDSVDQARLLNDLLASEFSRRDASRDNELSEFLAAGGTLSKLIGLAFELVEHYDVMRNSTFDFVKIDLEQATALLKRDTIRWLEFADANCIGIEDLGYQQIAKVARSRIEAERVNGQIRQIDALADLNSNRGNKKNWKADSLIEFKAGILQLKDEAKSTMFRYRASILERAIGYIFNIIESLQEHKRKNGLLTFQDQLYYASRLFEDQHLRTEISQRFRSVLIDEFQDTDPLQAQIALSMIGRENRMGEASICIVGDAKQSIYRFRRADGRLFHRVTEQIAGFGRKVSISQNFRSTSGIIDFVNAFFAFHWGNNEQANYVPLQSLAERASPMPLPSVEFLELPEHIDLTSMKTPEIRRAEANAIAGTILQVIDEGWKTLQLGAEQNAVRTIKYEDIVILMPARTGIDVYTEALARKGIPFHVEGGKGLFSSRFVRDLLNLIRAIDNPADKLSVVGAARSILLGVNDAEIGEWGRLSSNSFDIYSPPESISEHLTQVIGHLVRWSTDKFYLSPIQMLDSIAKTCSIEESILSNPVREIDAELWNSVLGFARSETLEGKNLRHFKGKLERLISGDLEVGGANISKSGNRIRIMTVHSAKGLEFPMVILANFGKPGNHKPKVIADRDLGVIDASIKTWDDEYLMTTNYSNAEEIEKEEMSNERLRFLYVAMTRARDHLLISSIHQQENNPYAEWYNQFLASIDPIDKQLFNKRIWKSDSSNRIADVEKDEQINLEDAVVKLSLLIKERQSGILNTMSARVKIIKPGSRPDDGEKFDNKIIYDKSLDNAVKIGRAVHSYMARTEFNELLNHRLIEKVSEEEMISPEEVLPRVSAILSQNFWRKVIVSGKAHREIPITAIIENNIIRGVIDLIWEEGGSYYIADYKTGTPDVLRQMNQVDVYANAFEKCTGRNVGGKWLIYSSGHEAIFWHRHISS